MAAAMKHMASNFAKLEKFEGFQKMAEEDALLAFQHKCGNDHFIWIKGRKETRDWVLGFKKAGKGVIKGFGVTGCGFGELARYRYCKNLKKTVKTGQTRTRERS
ncbi:hypothetical protein Tco_0393696 [Tanacetum coccineum]